MSDIILFMLRTIQSGLVSFATRLGLVRHDNEAAQRRIIEAVRVWISIAALWRTMEIVLSSRYYYDPTSTLLGITTSPAVLWGAAMCVLLGCLAVGFATPLVLVALLICYPRFDEIAATQTLGTYMLTLSCIFLLLAGAGRQLSLDSLIGRGTGRFARLWGLPHRLIGDPGPRDLGVIRLVTLLAFWSISVGAALYHLADEYWRSGDTIRSLMTSSYLARNWELIRAIETAVPEVVRIASIVSGILQTGWELLMVPLAATLWGRRFVIGFGILFFLISSFILQLSYLPTIEFAVWAAIWLTGPTRSRRIPVFFDDRCNLCRRSVAALRLLDVTGELEFQPISASGVLLAERGIEPEAALTDMHGIVDGHTRSGFALYFAIAHRLPLLWMTLPLWYLLSWTRIGPALYGWVAARRVRLFGTCDIVGPETTNMSTSRAGLSAIALTLAVTWVLLIPVQLQNHPVVRGHLAAHGVPIDPAPSQPLRRFLIRWGLDSPDVFNRTDLRMGDVWVVVRRRQVSAGEWHTVPLAGRDGQRGRYLDSDVLYFGTDLVLRRSFAPILDATGRIDALDEPQRTWLNRVAIYDYRIRGLEGEHEYRAQVFVTDASNVNGDRPTRYRRSLQLTYELKVNGGAVVPGSIMLRPSARRSDSR